MSKLDPLPPEGAAAVAGWREAQDLREARFLRSLEARSLAESRRRADVRRRALLPLLWRLTRPLPGLRRRLEERIIETSPYFDAGWYLAKAPDVAAANLAPAAHYLRHGADERRDPGPFFSTSSYWHHAPDVLAEAMNPLVHFHVAGCREGRWFAPSSKGMALGRPIPERVVYVVGHTIPYSSNGYAIRTHEMAKALTRAGHDVVVLAFPGRPWSIEGFPADDAVPRDRRIEGVRYVTLPCRNLAALSAEGQAAAAKDLLAEAFRVFRPASVVAASDWRIALPAAEAARRSGAVFFYEQRGFWDLGRDRATETERAADRAAEARVADMARAVIVLGKEMQEELLRRGVPQGKIALVPNGVAPARRSAMRLGREALGCTSRYLVGYVGSYHQREGLEDLFAAVARLRREGLDVGVLCVGGDEPKGLVKSSARPQVHLGAIAARFGLGAQAHILPRVPWAEVAGVYNLLDLVVIPRRDTAVTRLVPPLKPYAAAAHGCPVLMSDLPPLVEVAQDIEGRTFAAGDIDDLARGIRASLGAGKPQGETQSFWAVSWAQRIRPLSRRLRAIEDEARRAQRQGVPFDLTQIPRAFLSTDRPRAMDIGIGPCADLRGTIHLATRQDLLAEVATRPPATLVIDWAGLRQSDGEWAGLWQTENIRLAKQVFDACRIATDRGWRVAVIGPVDLAEAPLFGMIARSVDILAADLPALDKAS